MLKPGLARNYIVDRKRRRIPKKEETKEEVNPALKLSTLGYPAEDRKKFDTEGSMDTSWYYTRKKKPKLKKLAVSYFKSQEERHGKEAKELRDVVDVLKTRDTQKATAIQQLREENATLAQALIEESDEKEQKIKDMADQYEYLLEKQGSDWRRLYEGQKDENVKLQEDLKRIDETAKQWSEYYKGLTKQKGQGLEDIMTGYKAIESPISKIIRNVAKGLIGMLMPKSKFVGYGKLSKNVHKLMKHTIKFPSYMVPGSFMFPLFDEIRKRTIGRGKGDMVYKAGRLLGDIISKGYKFYRRKKTANVFKNLVNSGMDKGDALNLLSKPSIQKLLPIFGGAMPTKPKLGIDEKDINTVLKYGFKQYKSGAQNVYNTGRHIGKALSGKDPLKNIHSALDDAFWSVGAITPIGTMEKPIRNVAKYGWKTFKRLVRGRGPNLESLITKRMISMMKSDPKALKSFVMTNFHPHEVSSKLFQKGKKFVGKIGNVLYPFIKKHVGLGKKISPAELRKIFETVYDVNPIKLDMPKGVYAGKGKVNRYVDNIDYIADIVKMHGKLIPAKVKAKLYKRMRGRGIKKVFRKLGKRVSKAKDIIYDEFLVPSYRDAVIPVYEDTKKGYMIARRAGVPLP